MLVTISGRLPRDVRAAARGELDLKAPGISEALLTFAFGFYQFENVAIAGVGQVYGDISLVTAEEIRDVFELSHLAAEGFRTGLVQDLKCLPFKILLVSAPFTELQHKVTHPHRRRIANAYTHSHSCLRTTSTSTESNGPTHCTRVQAVGC